MLKGFSAYEDINSDKSFVTSEMWKFNCLEAVDRSAFITQILSILNHNPDDQKSRRSAFNWMYRVPYKFERIQKGAFDVVSK